MPPKGHADPVRRHFLPAGTVRTWVCIYCEWELEWRADRARLHYQQRHAGREPHEMLDEVDGWLFFMPFFVLLLKVEGVVCSGASVFFFLLLLRFNKEASFAVVFQLGGCAVGNGAAWPVGSPAARPAGPKQRGSRAPTAVA